MRVDLDNVKLVRPDGGWGRLHPSLHKAYAIARNRGYTDLGTYVDKPGDHGWNDKRRMAAAFDIGREDKFRFLGFKYLKAARLMRFYVKHHRELNIEYVILGKVIWSRRNGWRPYKRVDTSHMWHMHVSGHVAHLRP